MFQLFTSANPRAHNFAYLFLLRFFSQFYWFIWLSESYKDKQHRLGCRKSWQFLSIFLKEILIRLNGSKRFNYYEFNFKLSSLCFLFYNIFRQVIRHQHKFVYHSITINCYFTWFLWTAHEIIVLRWVFLLCPLSGKMNISTWPVSSVPRQSNLMRCSASTIPVLCFSDGNGE